MGGMGFIENNKSFVHVECPDQYAPPDGIPGSGGISVFFCFFCCVYPADKQTNPHVTPLKEADAYPAMPEDGYGWEKLFSERMCRHLRRFWTHNQSGSVSQTCMGHWALGMAAARRRRLQFAVKS